MKANRKILLLGLAGGLVLGSGSRVKAAEPTDQPAPPQTAPSALTGKVVAVDKAQKSITVDIKGRIFVFKLSPKLAVRLNNKVVPATSLSPGQTIGLTAQRNSTGSFEIVALDIQPNEEPIAAAGPVGESNSKVKPKPDKTFPWGGQPPGVPFRSEPNPANLSGRDVSPH